MAALGDFRLWHVDTDRPLCGLNSKDKAAFHIRYSDFGNRPKADHQRLNSPDWRGLPRRVRWNDWLGISIRF